MNYCHRCQSSYSQPGTCNCFAGVQPAVPSIPYPAQPTIPAVPPYPWREDNTAPYTPSIAPVWISDHFTTGDDIPTIIGSPNTSTFIINGSGQAAQMSDNVAHHGADA